MAIERSLIGVRVRGSGARRMWNDEGCRTGSKSHGCGRSGEAGRPTSCPKASGSFASTPSATKCCGPTSCDCTRSIEKSVDPTTALKVGLKVDSDVLPAGILKKVDLKSPATTVALLKMNAIVGLQATVDANNHLTRVGVTCALCHSTVDNSVMPGIGRRKDGWPNRDLNVGAIIALSPALTAGAEGGLHVVGTGQIRSRATTRTARTRRWSCRPRTAWRRSRTKPTPRRVRSRIGTPMSPSRRWAGRGTSPTSDSGSTSSTRRIW